MKEVHVMSNEESLSFDTLKVRGGYNAADHNNSVSVPIYQSTAFELGDTERAARLFSFSEAAPLYTRIGNPTVTVLEERVAALDGAAGAIALASGMAAISYTLFNVAGRGGRILSSVSLYGGTVDSFNKIYPEFGIEIDITENPASFEKAITPDTKAIFVESITNPNSTVTDIEAVAEVAHKHGIPLIVDNTLATPYLLNPFKYGADIVVYSATKSLTGHGNVIAGLVLESGKFDWANGRFPQFTTPHYLLRDTSGVERNFLEVFPEFPFTGRIRAIYLNYLGAALGPFDAYLALLGLETLSERISKQVSNTEKIIRYLEGNDAVLWVKHPYATGNAFKALAEKYLPRGAGSVLTFGFKGTEQQYDKFINSVRLFSYHANIGDSKSIIINSPKTTHGELTPAQQKQAGIAPETIRLSIGLEDAGDLIADLEQAFEKAFK
jgi:O-acetylhomoserine (thiol)-lyase